MTHVLQANKTDTLASAFAKAATSATLTSGSFTAFTDGYLVVDYDVKAKLEIIKCTVSSTAVTSITRGQDGTSDVAHDAGAKVAFSMVPSHYAALTTSVGESAKTALNYVPVTPGTGWDLDKDGTEDDWTDWDLTAKTSSTAVRVKLIVRVKDDTLKSYMAFRKNGTSLSAADPGAPALRVTDTVITITQQIEVDMDSGQIIEYKTGDAGGSAIGEARADVIGYWEPV